MKQPLDDLHVLLTRSKSGNAAWADELTGLGANINIYRLATIQRRPLGITLPDLRLFDWLIFTSAAGVQYFTAYLPLDDIPPIAVVGTQSAAAVRKLGLTVDFIPARADGATLAATLPDAAGKHILLLRAQHAHGQIVHELQRRGASVTDLALYETSPIDTPSEEITDLLLRGTINRVVFGSPSAVRGFQGRVSSQALEAARHIPTIVLGHSTKSALEQAGFRQIFVAHEASPRGVIAALTS